VKFKKQLAMILVAAIVQLTVACTNTVKRSAWELTPNAKGYRISRVEKTSGEMVKFRRGTVGRVAEDEIRFGPRAYPAIPLSEVVAVWTKVPNTGMTILFVLGAGFVAFMAIGGLYMLITGQTLSIVM
jgi:hypothetical protein